MISSLAKNLKVVSRIAAVAAVTTFIVVYVAKKPSDAGLNCYSCSLVGTAGTLLDSELGQDIDSSDCVFRMGFSPLSGKQDDVGRKTTARIVDSLRFSRFMKFPEKLLSTSFASDRWYIFDAETIDRDMYKNILKGDGNGTWIDVLEHQKAYRDLKEYGGKPQSYELRGRDMSAFWFALHLMEILSCQKYRIYGVLDPDFCKREPDADIKSLYWKRGAVPQCRDGVDASLAGPDSNTPLQMPSLLERTAVREWAKDRAVQFIQPDWPES